MTTLPNDTLNPRPEKVAVVEEVRERFNAADAAILTEYRGLKVAELAALRRSLREAGGDYKIYKNTLVRFAARDLGLDSLEDLLVGPTAIAFVEGDAVGVARALRDYARTNPALVVKGGLLGAKVLTAKDTAALADIPPREVLLARLAGGFAAPMQQFAGLLAALPRNFAYGLKALIDKGGTGPAVEAEAPAAEPEPEAAPAADGAVTEAPGAEATETTAVPASAEATDTTDTTDTTETAETAETAAVEAPAEAAAADADTETPVETPADPADPAEEGA